MSEDAASRVESVLKIVGGTTAILAVIGYGFIRAWLNYLGIRDIALLPPSIYLYEAYAFISAAVAVLAPILIVAVPVSCIVALFFRRSKAVAALTRRLVSPSAGGPLFVTVPVPVVIIVVAILPGNGTAGILLKPNVFEQVQPMRLGVFTFAVLAGILTCLLVALPQPTEWARQSFGNTVAWACRGSGAIAAITLVWSSIVTFNVFVKPLSFSVIRISTKLWAGSQCFLLVLITDNEYVLWTTLSVPNHGSAFIVAKRSDTSDLIIEAPMLVSDFAKSSDSTTCKSDQLRWRALETEKSSGRIAFDARLMHFCVRASTIRHLATPPGPRCDRVRGPLQGWETRP